jgi:hypothetical protein
MILPKFPAATNLAALDVSLETSLTSANLFACIKHAPTIAQKTLKFGLL